MGLLNYNNHILNLDNHPGKIGVPEGSRKMKVAETISSDMSTPESVIALKGKDKLPVDFLPRARKHVTTKEKDVSFISKPEQQKRKELGQESKQEKKERKAAVKEERREARRMKKEMKELYKCEGQRAQKGLCFHWSICYSYYVMISFWIRMQCANQILSLDAAVMSV